MSLTVTPFQPKDASRWDAFVAESRNGTFFHTRKFLSYHPNDRFNDASFWVLDGSTPVAVLNAATKDIDHQRTLVSHPGASYGGLVFSKNVGVKDSGEILDAVTEHARQEKFQRMQFLRLTPPSLRQEFSDDQEYWMHQKGWCCMRFEMDGAIDVVGITEKQTMTLLTSKCRNMVRQAERASITVRETDTFADFWPLLTKVLEKHGVQPTHTLEEIVRLHSIAPDAVRLFGAFKESTLVAGIVVITIHSTALYTLYMAQDYAHQDAHPLHAILAELLHVSVKEGRRVLHLGVSTEDGGKVINEGLFFFKESFHCRPVRRESFEILL